MNEKEFYNNIENAEEFLKESEKRTVPNNRVGDNHYLDISSLGLDKILIFQSTDTSKNK